MPLRAALHRRCLRDLRVLVVDDDNETREAIMAAIAIYGGDPEGVDCALEARRRLVAARFDVLLSDINMPEEDGYALVRSVRAFGGASGTIPAAAVTARASADERRLAQAAGFDGILGKPFNLLELVGAVLALAAMRPR